MKLLVLIALIYTTSAFISGPLNKDAAEQIIFLGTAV